MALREEEPSDRFLELLEWFDRMPECPGAIGVMLSEQARHHSDRAAVTVGGSTLTFSELDRSATRRAGALLAAGVRPGDRVAYLCDSGMEVTQLLYAAWRVGAINVPLNIFLRGKPLEYQLLDSASSTIVADRDGLDILAPLLTELPDLRLIVFTGGTPPADQLHGVKVISFEALTSDERIELPDVVAESPAAIMYTSGTTGLPKGCVLSHRYFHHVGREWSAVFELTDDDVYFSVSPLYHFGGLIPLMAALVTGIPIVVEPVFSASGFFPRVAEVGATVCAAVGFIAVGLLAQPESAADRSHRLRVFMLTPISEPDRVRFEARFGVAVLSENYGQTECTLGATSVIGGSRKAGSAGRPAPWIEMAIVDPHSDRLLGTDEVGEIVLRPRRIGVMFDGYWGKPETTLNTFRNLWHHTGDLGRLDADGFLFFADRKNDAIRRRGENVSSFEVEQRIAAHAAVVDVAVVPISILGEVDATIKACVVLDRECDFDIDEFAGHLRSELPYFAVPRFVEVMDELPRNASGRVMKFELRERSNAEPVWDLQELQLLGGREQRRRL